MTGASPVVISNHILSADPGSASIRGRISIVEANGLP